MAEMGGHEVSVVNVQAQPDVVEVPPAAQAHGPARFQWTDAISGFMLRLCVKLIEQGVKIDMGFKEEHLNSVAKDVAEYSGLPCTGNQVYEHLRMWRARWMKVCKLKELSGISWDETCYMIKLEESYYAQYIQAFPKDAKFLNRPINNYMEMQIIFGNGVAVEQYAMQSTEALGQPFECIKLQALNKERKQSVDNEEFTDAVKSTVHPDVSPVIYEQVMNIPGFTREQLVFGLSYFVDNKGTAEAFVQMSGEEKVPWLMQFLGKHNIMRGLEVKLTGTPEGYRHSLTGFEVSWILKAPTLLRSYPASLVC